MRDHLRRWRVVYAVLALLAGWPAFVMWLNRDVPLDPATLDAVAAWADARLAELDPASEPPKPEIEASEYGALEGRWQELETSRPPIVSEALKLLDASQLASAPAAGEQVAILQEYYGPLLAEFDALSTGVLPAVMSPPPDLLAMQNRARLHRLFAEAAIGRGEGDAALGHLVKCAGGSSVLGEGDIALLSITAGRLIAAGGFHSMLLSEPDLATARAALAALKMERRGAEKLDALRLRQLKRAPELALAQGEGGRVGNIDWAMTVIGIGYTRGRLVMPSAGAEQADWMEPPRERRWTWSARAAKRRPLLDWLEANPYFTAGVGVGPAWEPGLDPFTLLVVRGTAGGGAAGESEARIKVRATWLGLLERAFAAQIEMLERGVWPDGTAAAEAEGNSAPDADLFTPLNFAIVEPDSELLDAYWATLLPGRGGVHWSARTLGSAAGESQLRVTFNRQDEWPSAPLLFIGWVMERPELFRNVELWADPEIRPAYRITVDDVRKIAEEKSGREMGTPAADEPFSLILVAEVATPRRLAIAWSPGPDGIDEQARLSYDPTNGTLSGGDIIVFAGARRN